MKNFLLTILLVTPLFMFGQEEEAQGPPPVYELITLFPKQGAGQDLADNMKKHNDMYHKDAPYTARCYNGSTGNRVGQLFWVMGPTSWDAMENRPSEGGHDEDWAQNITPHMQKPPVIDYLVMDTKRSYYPADFTIDNIYIWWIDLKAFQSHRFEAMLDDILEVYKQKLPDEPYGVFWNSMGDSDDGNDVMIAWYFDDLNWMGKDRDFSTKFVEVHGANAWAEFMRDWEDILKGSESFIINYNSKMGGADPLIKVAERQ